MQSLTPEEKSYRELKQKTLENLLGEYYTNPEWIWVGPHSRRKATFQISGKNLLGFFAEKSKDLIEINEYPEAEKEIENFIPILKNFLKTQDQNFFTQIAITLFDSGLDLVFVGKNDLNFSQSQKMTNFAKEQNLNISYSVKNHLTPILLLRKNQIFYHNFKINLTSDIFIQATKSGLDSIVKIIRDFLAQNKKIKNIADLYAGFGSYSFAISDLPVQISAFEGDEKMTNLIIKNAAENNLSNRIKVEMRDLFASPLSKNKLNKFDLAIINPPRNGASPQAIELAKSDLKNVIYVSCNPESFKRDADILIKSGFKISRLVALDQFYLTKHLELISIFSRD